MIALLSVVVSRRIILHLLFFAIAVSPAFAADPDFSGTWALDEARTERRRLPDVPWRSMKVEHTGTEVRCILIEKEAPVQAPKNALLMNFLTDGKETIHRSGGASQKSIAKWEGSALLINTIVSGPQRSYTQMDRWKLSRDGSVLTIRRQIVTLHGETESTLVYEKR